MSVKILLDTSAELNGNVITFYQISLYQYISWKPQLSKISIWSHLTQNHFINTFLGNISWAQWQCNQFQKHSSQCHSLFSLQNISWAKHRWNHMAYNISWTLSWAYWPLNHARHKINYEKICQWQISIYKLIYPSCLLAQHFYDYITQIQLSINAR